jgi:hypothetical protein
MDDRRRYETVKSRLRALGEGTAQEVHASMDEPNPYSSLAIRFDVLLM